MRSPLGHRILVLAIAGLTAVLWVYACGDGTTEPLPANPPKAISVAVDSVSGTSTVTVAQAGNSDRAALVALYEATDGPNWVNNENWLTDAPLGEWFGVETDSLGRVVRLEMTYYDWDRREWIANNLSGPLPAELGNLAELERMQLRSNSLTGPIPPELGSLDNLERLDLRSNGLTGPIRAELEGLVNLTRLLLGDNELSGSIPPELGGLGRLTVLNLGTNRLTGSVPPEFGDLADLEQLYLDDNDLAGPIPSELGNLVKLERLYLYSNNLTGPIPSELDALANLQRLYLFSNQFTGSIPPELGSLGNLERLYLGGNRLTGPIPPELGSLGKLERLRLTSNGLTGSIPSELGSLANLTELDLADNQLTGPIPHSFLQLEQLRHFWIVWNESLCLPGVSTFANWWQGIESPDEGAISCNAADVTALTSLFEKAGGAGWTNSGGWLDDFAVADWYGVSSDSLGHVTALDLANNGLAGPLTGGLGNLTQMTALRIGGNALTGRLPLSLAELPLSDFRYASTELCAPIDRPFRSWLNAIPSHEGTGLDCATLTDREALNALYDATNGPGWTNSENWLTDAPLVDWHGVEADESGRVVVLRLTANHLRGRIPREIGGLANLERLDLYSNGLTGPIPVELGNLTKLTRLRLRGNQLTGTIAQLANLANLGSLDLRSNRLTGRIPPELGEVSSLRRVNLNQNRLAGHIPPELGGLANLRELALGGNDLMGPIPSELGDLVHLQELDLAANRLTGPVLPELAGLAELEALHLGENELTGPVPQELGRLASLRHLTLQRNAEMSGSLPDSLTNLSGLETLQAEGTGLCSPSGTDFQEWLASVPNRRIAPCEGGPAVAYLVQAVQSRKFPVPLVAGEEALLRVFVTAGRNNAERLPPIRASFTLNGTLAHVADIPSKPGPIPTEVEEGSLAASVNAVIPAEVVHPGLELVVEIDPDGTLDPGLGVAKRIPDTGLLPVEVHEMPVLNLKLIPFLWAAYPDSAVLVQSAGMVADPDGHELLADAHIMLPVGDIDVTRHEPVVTSSNDVYSLHAETHAIRAIEGGSGHWMGMISGPKTGAGGLGSMPGRVSTVGLSAGVIAHELGHNMSLPHAPCGATDFLDRAYPYADGSIGAWGYDRGSPVAPFTPDLMSYCYPKWVSDYNFTKALRYRLADEGSQAAATLIASSAPSLLLWGGVDAEGNPYLEPAFAVNAPPALPKSGGEYRVTGRSVDGTELFSLAFAMPETPHAGNASSFAFVLPANGGWRGALATITLSGSGGTFTLDADSDTPMAIVRDPRTQAVRAILRGVEDAGVAQAAAMSAPQSGTDAGLEVLFSRGLPDFAAWGR